MVTTVGVKYMADNFAGGSASIGDFKYHQVGTQATAEATSDVGCLTPVESRFTGSQASAFDVPNAQYSTSAIIVVTAPRVLREHALMSALVGGTCWDRSVFSAITLPNPGDAVQFTYILTIQAGN